MYQLWLLPVDSVLTLLEATSVFCELSDSARIA